MHGATIKIVCRTQREIEQRNYETITFKTENKSIVTNVYNAGF